MFFGYNLVLNSFCGTKYFRFWEIIIKRNFFLSTLLLHHMSSTELPDLTGLDEGTTAPNFTGIGVCDENQLDLHELAKKHNGVLLIFFRGAWWNHWHAFFTRLHADLDFFHSKDVVIVGVSGDRAVKLKEQMCKYGLVLVSDLPKHEIAITYKTFTYQSQAVDGFSRTVKINQPITYLINPEAKIVWKFVGTREIRPPNNILKNAVEKYL